MKRVIPLRFWRTRELWLKSNTAGLMSLLETKLHKWGILLYQFKVTQLYSPTFRRMSYGIMASTEENGTCTYTAYIPDISCNKDFVDTLAQRCARGQLSPMHLLDVVLDALP